MADRRSDEPTKKQLGFAHGKVNPGELAKQRQVWTLALKRALAHKGGSVSEGLFLVGKKAVELALDGNMWAIQHIADRVEGKVKEHVEVETKSVGEREDAAREVAQRFFAAAAEVAKGNTGNAPDDAVH